MKRPFFSTIGSAFFIVGAICLGDDLQNRQLLETLPRDRRESLAGNLAEFDGLPGPQQAAIRRLDATIAATEPVEQVRYVQLLQHYHLWFQGLTVEQRDQLLSTTDLDERFALARKLRIAEQTGPKRDGPRVARIRTGDFGLLGPYEAAHLLKIWQALPPEKRNEIEKKPAAKIRDELKSQATALKIHFDRFTLDQEKAFDGKLERDPDFKLIEPALQRIEQAIRGTSDAGKKAANIEKKAVIAHKKAEHPFAEFLYFEENRPKVVDPGRLERFAESCPEWFRVLTDSLAADDARDYYSTVYRLVYPSPTEMPEPVKPAKVVPNPTARQLSRPKADPGGSAF